MWWALPDKLDTLRSFLKVRRMPGLFLILMMLLHSISGDSAYAETSARTIVMPYKLAGTFDIPTGKAEALLDNEHKQRLAMADSELRKGLQTTGKYDLVDEAASKAFSEKVIVALNNNDCNHCEAEYAKPLNAKLIIAPFVFKLSQLVLTMHFVILDGNSGKIISKKALDFRGDNDQSWQRAIQYFVKNIEKP